MTRRFAVGSVMCLILAFALHDAAARKRACHGTDILHFKVKTSMVSSGAESNAAGSVSLNQNQQGNANNQRLTISVNNLGSNTIYSLLASLRSDTNFTEVATLTTDANGEELVKYTKKNNGNGKAGGTPLPDALNPLSDILALEIANGTQAVLSADLTQPDQLQYLIKRCLTSTHVETDASGSLRIKATQQSIQFRLAASSLTTNATYFLSINDTTLNGRQSDAKGNLVFSALPEGSPDVLDISTVAVQDASSNDVLNTTLP
jgi:hypothetical protein